MGSRAIRRDVAWIAGIVYFIQGALGIASIALPLFLRDLKWSVAEITVVSSIATAPWIFKIVYGILSDTLPLWGYRRKPYLILCSLLSALGWFGMAMLPSDKLWVICALLTANFGFAATDVITDGLIVEHSTEEASPVFQSIAWAARSGGALISGVTGGLLAAHTSPRVVFLITMALPFLVTFSVIKFHEEKQEAALFKSALEPVKQCFKLLFSENIRWFTAILFLIGVPSTFGVPFFFFLKEKLEFTETFLGILTSLGWAGAMLGSLFYAKWLKAVSPKKMLAWVMVLNSANIFSTLLIQNRETALLLIFIGGILGALTLLPIMSSSARLTYQTGVEGTLFAVLMSIFNLGQVSFGFLGGRLVETVSLNSLILSSGVAALTGLFFVSKLRFKVSDGS